MYYWVTGTQCFKDLVDAALHRTRLLKEEILLSCKLLGLSTRDSPIRQIYFVSDQYDFDFRIALFADILEPRPDISEGLLLCYVVDDDCSVGVPIVSKS